MLRVKSLKFQYVSLMRSRNGANRIGEFITAKYIFVLWIEKTLCLVVRISKNVRIF